MHPIENIIWKALTTRQTQFAESRAHARRFLPEVTLLSAFDEPNAAGYASLRELVREGETLAIFIDREFESAPGWQLVAKAPLVQMICEHFKPAENDTTKKIVPLGLADSPEMMALTALTKPGPFGPRTHELGYYAGIRVDGKLVAMAGERLKVPGHTEVSAVCTHPDHLGQGYAQALMSDVMRQIIARGETPILHSRADNARAIAIYEKLGFRTSKEWHFAVLRKVTERDVKRGQSSESTLKP